MTGGNGVPDGAGLTAGARLPGSDPDTRLSVLDRALYALFARHADSRKHAADRKRYRGTDVRVSFDVYLSRVYGLSWLVCVLVMVPTLVVLASLPAETIAAVDAFLDGLVPGDVPALASVPRFWVAVVGAGAISAVAKGVTVRAGGRYLKWAASARRTDIERTLPGAVRYLHALSSGSDDPRSMLRKTAANDAYGETAVAFRTALNTTRLTGSLDDALRRTARDTPSRDLLAPFLLKFREHASQGEDALANYLRMESRMLGHRQDRARKRAEGFLELLAELFIVLLVLPALLVIVLTVMSVLAPGLSAPIATPLGAVSTRALVVYGSAAFILVVGLAAAATVETLRPADQQVSYALPSEPLAVLATATRNPASAAVVVAVPSVVLTAAVAVGGATPVTVALLGYVAFAVPVGTVAVRRARLDDAKDREIKDFVHAVSGHVSLGRPFSEAVELVARDVDLGALDDDVADLAFNLGLTTAATETARNDGAGLSAHDDEAELRTAALEEFVAAVGTPLSEQTVGLVTGALDAGSDTETVFETLQTEIGRLYHEKQALRSAMLVYVAVGWTTALLVIGIVAAVNLHVIDGFAQLSSMSGSALDPTAIQPARERFRFYVVTQATMLSSGWFAGVASRGWYEALLHSGLLVAICYVIFAGVGMI